MMDNSVEMVKIMERKIISAKSKNLNALFFDLEKEEWEGRKFDLLIMQMVLHHVDDLDNIFRKFQNIIAPGGYIAIADLYSEDGSFHGINFTGHKGFDIEFLSDKIGKQGFTNIIHQKCFTINKEIYDKTIRQFDVFLLTAKLGNSPQYEIPKTK
jgi:SAM-dependent methyltransferase